MTPDEHAFLDRARVARLATADASGAPHLVPVCFAMAPSLDTSGRPRPVRVYITVDEKPKRVGAAPLKRIRNILENPAVALLVDHYDDRDWSRLAWLMLRGRAEVIGSGDEHALAQTLLRIRYPQYRVMRLETLPVIAISVHRVTSWGALG